MGKLKEFVEKNALIIAVSLLCFSTRLFLYRPAPPGWDESTYIQIGKYLFSGGEVGFLEPFRPLFWPTVLGLFWKLNLDPVVSGHVLTLLCSLGNIVLVYLIGNRVYGRGTGILAALLLGISPSFFFWGNGMLTEIPASFLGLLSFYLVLKERYFLSGLLGVLAFAMKFVHLFTLIPIVGAVFYRFLSQRSSGLKTPLVQYLLGCVPAAMVLASAHLVLYGDFFLPFTHGRLVYTQVPFGWIEGIQYVFRAVWKIEGGLLIFVPLAFFSGRRFLTEGRMVILAIALLQFSWVAKLPTELSRFLLSLSPYLYLLTAEGMAQSHALFKKIGGEILLTVVLAVFVGVQFYRTITIRFPASPSNILKEYFIRHEKDVAGAVWISNPVITVDSNLKIAQTIYYPVFDRKKIAALRAQLPQADFIFWDSESLRCPPLDQPACQISRDQLLETIKQNFHADFYREEPATSRVQGVFRKKT